jgi:hypothetical protein
LNLLYFFFSLLISILLHLHLKNLFPKNTLYEYRINLIKLISSRNGPLYNNLNELKFFLFSLFDRRTYDFSGLIIINILNKFYSNNTKSFCSSSIYRKELSHLLFTHLNKISPNSYKISYTFSSLIITEIPNIKTPIILLFYFFSILENPTQNSPPPPLSIIIIIFFFLPLLFNHFFKPMSKLIIISSFFF